MTIPVMGNRDWEVEGGGGELSLKMGVEFNKGETSKFPPSNHNLFTKAHTTI